MHTQGCTMPEGKCIYVYQANPDMLCYNKLYFPLCVLAHLSSFSLLQCYNTFKLRIPHVKLFKIKAIKTYISYVTAFVILHNVHASI